LAGCRQEARRAAEEMRAELQRCAAAEAAVRAELKEQGQAAEEARRQAQQQASEVAASRAAAAKEAELLRAKVRRQLWREAQGVNKHSHKRNTGLMA
jgi:hypothetical protein